MKTPCFIQKLTFPPLHPCFKPFSSSSYSIADTSNSSASHSSTSCTIVSTSYPSLHAPSPSPLSPPPISLALFLSQFMFGSIAHSNELLCFPLSSHLQLANPMEDPLTLSIRQSLGYEPHLYVLCCDGRKVEISQSQYSSLGVLTHQDSPGHERGTNSLSCSIRLLD